MKPDKYYAFCVSIIKSLKKFGTMKSSHDNGKKYDSDKRSQNFLF